jgi:hypothetical protein
MENLTFSRNGIRKKAINKVLLTFFILAIYRLGNGIPLYGIDQEALKRSLLQIENKNAIMYAGALFEKFGIKTLLDAFSEISNNYELWLFGFGDLTDYITEQSKKDNRIKFFGNLPNDIVLDYEKKARLLINPRPLNHEFTKNSFPSKILEYMTSGTPVLTTKLPGIPDDYSDKLFFFDDDTKFSIKNGIINYMNKSDCELYNYNGIKTIIMSHVFEHLYAPRLFLNKITATSIENIFISIPDMANLMINGDLNNLNILHTYYINSQFLIYLFNLYGFNLEINENLYNNSNFYYFKKNIKITTYGYDYKNLHLINQIKLFYSNEIEKIKKLKIIKPFYICPSGFYGQFIYFNLTEETKLNLLGFLDSDKFKINKRLSGTNLYNFEKDIIKNINEIYILISSVKHRYEIINELTNYNNNIIFINI